MDRAARKHTRRQVLYFAAQAALCGASAASSACIAGARSETATRFAQDPSITPRALAGGYNNFVEFGSSKQIAGRAQLLSFSPWTIEIAGLALRTGRYDASDLIQRFPATERTTRLRCVEAWSAVVPWTGFALRALLDWIEPSAGAHYVRFESFYRPLAAWGQILHPLAPWPYVEALRLDEALHPLTLLASGIYGEPLPPQHGAPLRLVVPWKYGYKSIKSIARIELVRERPSTFWNAIDPDGYGFLGNVDPRAPHPRWSQASERRLGHAERFRTELFNGYADEVAGLYR